MYIASNPYKSEAVKSYLRYYLIKDLEEFSNLPKVKRLVSSWIQSKQACVLSTTLSCMLQKMEASRELKTKLWLKNSKIQEKKLLKTQNLFSV